MLGNDFLRIYSAFISPFNGRSMVIVTNGNFFVIFSLFYTIEIIISFPNAINIWFSNKPEITLTFWCPSWAGGLRELPEHFSGSLWLSHEEHGSRVCPHSARMSPLGCPHSSLLEHHLSLEGTQWRAAAWLRTCDSKVERVQECCSLH